MSGPPGGNRRRRRAWAARTPGAGQPPVNPGAFLPAWWRARLDRGGDPLSAGSAAPSSGPPETRLEVVTSGGRPDSLW